MAAWRGAASLAAQRTSETTSALLSASSLSRSAAATLGRQRPSPSSGLSPLALTATRAGSSARQPRAKPGEVSTCSGGGCFPEVTRTHHYVPPAAPAASPTAFKLSRTQWQPMTKLLGSSPTVVCPAISSSSRTVQTSSLKCRAAAGNSSDPSSSPAATVEDPAAASAATAAAAAHSSGNGAGVAATAGVGPKGGGRGRAVASFRKRVRVADLKGGEDEGLSRVGSEVQLNGWVRTVRSQKAFSFIELNDGSSLSGIQIVATPDIPGYDEIDNGSLTTGAAIAVEGELVASQGKGQKVEIKASKLRLVGGSDGSTYPLQKKRHSLEYLRSIAHLRPRTNTIGAVSRVRSVLAQATHQFFAENGFVWVATPIITASDCEGAGDQFCVTTLIPESAAEPAHSPVARIPTTKSGDVDWTEDFFKRPAFLTVSGQLNAEIYACALHDVYTFGPTFRAENSNTSRHLAEFWMIEPELAFADLDDDMACASSFLKYILGEALDKCKEDYAFFNKFVEPGIIDRLTSVVESEFRHITYTDAVNQLLKAKQKFEYPVKWGIDLQSEHERYLTEKVFKGQPVIVTDYPKDIKAFYMRLNDDGKTVAAMDVLVPRVGELIGGSQREERLDVLEGRMDEMGLNKDSYWWYLDLRRYGSVPHAGFGAGFERLVQFATGVENIRDVIPFPRAPGLAEF